MPILETDEDRWAFLESLDESEDIEVTEWEARFIETQLRFQQQAKDQGEERGFTEGQARVIDRMFDSYGERL